MKKLKLFPKIFLYTLALMGFVVGIAHLLIYLLAPQNAFSVTLTDPVAHTAKTIAVGAGEETVVVQAIQNALPFSLLGSFGICVICSFLFSKAIVAPLARISAATGQMMQLDRAAVCTVNAKDEIGTLAQNINDLYATLLSTIRHLEQEKDQVREMERAKVDFLRAASHELKTPVTALNATLENMILGVGKYQDHAAYLPVCKEMTERLSGMIHEILETSKLHGMAEQPTDFDMPELLKELCAPYQLIAAAHGITFLLAVPEKFTVTLPPRTFRKAVSNVVANAVAYTEAGKTVTVTMKGRSLTIENACDPIQSSEIPRLFEPFYRPDYARDRAHGGNGLGLSIVDMLLTSLHLPYSFTPMQTPPGMCFTIQL